MAATLSVTVTLEPVATVKGLEGLEVAPAGRLVSATWTALANPFWPITETVKGELDVPCEMLMEEGERVKEKSGLGGGGGPAAPAPPPQPTPVTSKTTSKVLGTHLAFRPIADNSTTFISGRATTQGQAGRTGERIIPYE
ncbi:MAG: hypothetical protein PVS2B2_18290 [Candidatus Acidiferrum sp.]